MSIDSWGMKECPMDDWQKGMNKQKKLDRQSSWAWELFEGTQETSSVTPRDMPSFGY